MWRQQLRRHVHKAAAMPSAVFIPVAYTPGMMDFGAPIGLLPASNMRGRRYKCPGGQGIMCLQGIIACPELQLSRNSFVGEQGAMLRKLLQDTDGLAPETVAGLIIA